VIRVIDGGAFRPGHHLKLHADALRQSALCCLQAG
jgi:hypothetical protein